MDAFTSQEFCGKGAEVRFDALAEVVMWWIKRVYESGAEEAVFRSDVMPTHPDDDLPLAVRSQTFAAQLAKALNRCQKNYGMLNRTFVPQFVE